MDTGLVSRRAVIPDEGGEADACTTTADGFRAIALRSLDWNKGVSLHTFCLLEDVCVRLLIKNLGRQMQEGEVEDWVSVQGVQLCSGLRYQESFKTGPLTPHFIMSVARRQSYAACESRWRRTSP